LLFLSTIHASSNYEDGIFGEGSQDISSMRVFYATLIGLFVGGAISSVTEYYTGLGTKPVMAIVQKSSTGAGNVIAGLATGMISPTVLLCCSDMVYLCIGRFYGVALAASAMMATTAMQLAMTLLMPGNEFCQRSTYRYFRFSNTTAATGKLLLLRPVYCPVLYRCNEVLPSSLKPCIMEGIQVSHAEMQYGYL
jgi:hypothetical protein